MAKKKAEKQTDAVITVKGELKIKAGKPAPVSSSEVAYKGPLFSVIKEEVHEPGTEPVNRDVIRHNGSVVILAVDDSKSKKDPFIVIERQYRHAAGQYLYEVPAGKVDGDEERLAAAKRELIEETGFRAKKWTKLTRYFASPGFLGEWMQVYLAEGLTPGEAQPEPDEKLEIYLVRLSEVLRLIDAGEIRDGKTLVSVMLYARRQAAKKKR
ncbi:ADP-ribose pyrophosphatase [Silvibacterium bohemicum]|uniref:GDP-mannose pyrophosphatase n=1 Tax=Silvibacterium bohemicum TaxID=1577686 RepID=A0A841JP91_9BACT|nr:NUDIX hydrolase [Silvibacterium bohemicum]MBB6142407.1 ADP-ribose pyrophosphatase [Silvibacterium bohemicum]